MFPNPTEEPEGQVQVRDLFRRETVGGQLLGILQGLRSLPPMTLGLGLVVAFLLFLVGFAVGGGFESSAATAESGGFFITEAQAEERLTEIAELAETQSQLAIAGGESAFLRSQVSALTTDVQSLQRAVDRARVEMGIIVAIYEECLQQRHPTDCVDAARPRAEEFIGQLYSPGS